MHRSLTVEKWAEILGLYTDRDIRSTASTDALTTWPEIMGKREKDAFWEKIGRTTPPSQGHVTDPDLFLLYCLKEKRPANLVVALAKYLVKFSRGSLPPSVTAGCYVTVIARHFRLLTPENLNGLTLVSETRILDVPTLAKCEIVECVRDDKGIQRCNFAREGGRLPNETQNYRQICMINPPAASEQGTSRVISPTLGLVPVTHGSKFTQIHAMFTALMTAQTVEDAKHRKSEERMVRIEEGMVRNEERMTRIEEQQASILALLQDMSSLPRSTTSAPTTQRYARTASASTTSTSLSDTTIVRDAESALATHASLDPATHQ
ncbi:hypothetical protein Tco_0950438 [Tanacetum coccineum]